MRDRSPIQGELQAQIMSALWRLDSGTVEEVRAALPTNQSAYNTVQTVLNRLAERGLLGRERRGKAIVYRPLISEADYVGQAVDSALSSASPAVRQTVLAELIGGLEGDEVRELRTLARRIERKRAKRRK